MSFSQGLGVCLQRGDTFDLRHRGADTRARMLLSAGDLHRGVKRGEPRLGLASQMAVAFAGAASRGSAWCKVSVFVLPGRAPRWRRGRRARDHLDTNVRPGSGRPPSRQILQLVPSPTLAPTLDLRGFGLFLARGNRIDAALPRPCALVRVRSEPGEAARRRDLARAGWRPASTERSCGPVDARWAEIGSRALLRAFGLVARRASALGSA